MKLKYIPADSISKDVLKNFDCGISAFNYFLWEDYHKWQENMAGITYVLVDEEDLASQNLIIYAYATISTMGLLNNSESDDINYLSAVEIKLFAIHKRVRGVTDATNGSDTKYSHIFFALLLQDLWLASMNSISFKSIFIQANEPGANVYKEFGFVPIENYMAPNADAKLELEDCTPMLRLIDDDFMYDIFAG